MSDSEHTEPSIVTDKVAANTPSDDSLSLPDRMEAEAEEFSKCRDIHNARGNYGAAAVADRAWLRLREYAAELRESNVAHSDFEKPTTEDRRAPRG